MSIILTFMARSKNSTYLIGVETKAVVTEPLVCVEMPPVEMFGVFSLFADGVFVLGETLKEESKSLIFSYRVLLKTINLPCMRLQSTSCKADYLLVDFRSGLSFCLSAGGRYSTSCFRFR